MIDELNQAISAFKTKWEALVAARKSKDFFESLFPTSVGWKTVDLADLDHRTAELRDLSDFVSMSWANERWLVTFHLKDEVKLAWDIRLVTLMQRRPGSNDPTGLDNMSFYTPDRNWADDIFKQEKDLKWSHEENGPYCAWTAIWFDNTEAKIRDASKLDVTISEIQDINKQVLHQQ